MKRIDHTLRVGSTVTRVRLERSSTPAATIDKATIDDDEPVAVSLPAQLSRPFCMQLAGRSFRVAVACNAGGVEVSVDGRRFRVDPTAPVRPGIPVSAPCGDIRAPMPGRVVEVTVREGDLVRVGDSLLVIEAMKMRSSVCSMVAGLVKTVSCQVGEQVAGGQRVIEIDERDHAETDHDG